MLFNIYYYMNKDKENYDNIVNNQQDWLKGQKKYYDKQMSGDLDMNINPNIHKWYKLKNNKLVLNKPDMIKRSDVSNKVLNCSLLTECSELNNNECGYCHNENDNKNSSFFAWGDDKEPKTNVCGGTWTTNKDKCQKLKEYEICNKVKDCGDLYGDAAQTCGYCPITKKAVPVNIMGDKKAKYKKDFCAYPLLNNKNCSTYLSNNPCITGNYKTGPHTTECINKLWKQSNCTNKKPKNRDVNQLINDNTMLKNFMEIGKDFEDIYKKSNNSTNLNEAILYNNMCYGNTDKINVCNNIFNVNGIPSHKCLKQQFIDTGCGTGSDNEPSTGYYDLSTSDSHARGHINEITNLIKSKDNINTKEKYDKNLKKIIELAQGKGFYGFDYDKRKKAAKICYGTTPPMPPDIKRGDTILKRVNLGNKKIQGIEMNGLNLFEGIVINRDGMEVDIMWINIINETTRNKIKRENYSKHIQLQTKIFGWPGIAPLNKYNGITNKLNVKDLFVKESCCAKFTSGCKISCESQYLNTLNTYKQPKKCVLGWPKGKKGIPNKWSKWSKCSTDCGTGVKIKKKDIVYPASNGGYCPSISDSERYIKVKCNTNKCPRYGISDRMGNFYKNKKLWYKVDNNNNKNNLVANKKYKKSRLIDMFNMCDNDNNCYGVLESNKPSYYYMVWDKNKHVNGKSINNIGKILYKKI